tara:strand:- start:1213 stop:1653 length:441 start_codon:yes stop_codon:yes gene_type:complete
MRDGVEAVYVAQSSQQNARYTFGFTIGSRLPLLSTSIGRALLAWGDPTWARAMIADQPLERYTAETILDRDEIERQVAESRERGASVVKSEFETGAVGVAVPVGPLGAAEAALGLSEPISEINPNDIPRLTEVLHRFAGQITAVLK